MKKLFDLRRPQWIQAQLLIILFAILGLYGCHLFQPVTLVRKVERVNPALIHIVKAPGETYGSIAFKYSGSSKNWKKVQDLNPTIKANRIRKGARIRVPLEIVRGMATPAPRPTKKVAGKERNEKRPAVPTATPKPKGSREEPGPIATVAPKVTPSDLDSPDEKLDDQSKEDSDEQSDEKAEEEGGEKWHGAVTEIPLSEPSPITEPFVFPESTQVPGAVKVDQHDEPELVEDDFEAEVESSPPTEPTKSPQQLEEERLRKQYEEVFQDL